MKSIYLRNVPPATLDVLKKRARENHRSLQGELQAILEEAVRDQRLKEAANPIALKTVATRQTGSFPRDEIYGDSAR